MFELAKLDGRGVVVASLEEAANAAGEYAKASKSKATIRSYGSDLRDFEGWCRAHGLDVVPATPATVAAYISSLAQRGLSASSISRHVAAIAYKHKLAGLEPPTSAEAVRIVLSGIRRTIGTAAMRKAPATAEAVAAMVEGIEEEGMRGLRDRALLLLGFAGALRRSELIGLNVEDIEEAAEGLHVNIRRSKTDQEGAGQLVSIPAGSRLRPCEALRAWLEAAGITEGAIFRPIDKGGHVGSSRLTGCSVALIVKARAKAAGLEASAFSGHSLRAGFVTSALTAGADVLRVMDVTRHRELKTLKAYDRRAKAFQNHAGATFL